MFKITTYPISSYATWLACQSCRKVLFQETYGWRSPWKRQDVCPGCGFPSYDKIVGRYEVTETSFGLFGWRKHKTTKFMEKQP